MLRRLALSLTLLLLVIAAGVGFLAWTLSSRVIVPQPYSLMPEFEVLAYDAGVVTLPAPGAGAPQFARSDAVGSYGLLWEGGFGRLGEVLSRGGGSVQRALTIVSGAAPSTGTPARLDTFYYRQDPQADHGFDYQELTLDGEVGALRAWYVPGQGRTAALMLHGRRRGELAETQRMMPVFERLGMPVLAVAYRNHDLSAASPDGLYHYGASEWQDALTGARFLAAQGIDRVVLVGFSMGGAVALEALKRWDRSLPEPIAMVLDSPLVDPFAVVRLGAVEAGLPLPGTLTRLALLAARLRTGADFGSLDQVASARSLALPVLLIAGTADSTVPIEAVDAFAAAVGPNLVYYRLDGVEHVEGWNHDPASYEETVRAFVTGLEIRAQAQ